MRLMGADLYLMFTIKNTQGFIEAKVLIRWNRFDLLAQ